MAESTDGGVKCGTQESRCTIVRNLDAAAESGLMPQAGMWHIETLRLALVAMPGTRAESAYKYEPIYVFQRD
jgi:hypothetical protein